MSVTIAGQTASQSVEVSGHDYVLRDSDGNPILDGNGEPILAAEAPVVILVPGS